MKQIDVWSIVISKKRIGFPEKDSSHKLYLFKDDKWGAW